MRLLQAFIVVLGPLASFSLGPPISVQNFLSALKSCQHIMSVIHDPGKGTRLRTPSIVHAFIHYLSSAGIPFEHLFYPPDPHIHRHVRRHLDHCMIRHTFETKCGPKAQTIRLSSPFQRVDSYGGGLSGRIVHMNRELDLVFLYFEQEHTWDIPHYYLINPFLYCATPLNFILVGFLTHSSNLLLLPYRQIRIPCMKRKDALCFEKLDYVTPAGQPMSYSSILALFKQQRQNLGGAAVYFSADVNTPRGLYSWRQIEHMLIVGMSHVRLSHPAAAHGYHAFLANMQIPYLLSQKLNMTYMLVTKSEVSQSFFGARMERCRKGKINTSTRPSPTRENSGSAHSQSMVDFTSFRVVYTAKVELVKPAELKTLSIPAQPSVWYLLIASIVLVAGTAMALTKSTDVGNAIFVFATPLIGQTVPTEAYGQVRLRFFFAVWVLLGALIMSATYTNVISSLAVVPRVLPAKHTIEALLDQNYTAKYVDIETYNVMTAMIVITANIMTRSQQRVAKLQKRLFESIRPENLMHESVPMTVLVDFYANDARSSMEIMDERALQGWIQAMVEITGRDFYVCDEKLFRLPKYIYFDSLPNSDVAFETYKRLTDAGFVSYWRATGTTHLERYLTLMPIQLAKDEGVLRPSKPVEGTLLESLVNESFYVLLYGIVSALFAFNVEYVSLLSCSLMLL